MPQDQEHQQELNQYRAVLMKIMTEYLNLRVAHLYRVSESIRGQLDDLTYQMLSQIEAAIEGTRPFGGVRYELVDILIGDHVDKRRALLTPTDQNTMINDFIDKAEEAKDKTTTLSAIKDIRTLYNHFDPKLDLIIEALQSFVWIDFPDVISTANCEVSMASLAEIMKNKAVPDGLKRRTNRQLNRPLDGDLSLEEAILLHAHRVQVNVKLLKAARTAEEPYMRMIRREIQVSENEGVNQLIMKCATHLHNATQVQKGNEVSDQQKAAYGQAMGVDPAKITKESVIQFERKNLLDSRNRLAGELMTHSNAGPPVNHKELQLRDLMARFEKICGALKQAGVDLEKEPPKMKPVAE
jgi:hypothetical protein